MTFEFILESGDSSEPGDRSKVVNRAESQLKMTDLNSSILTLTNFYVICTSLPKPGNQIVRLA